MLKWWAKKTQSWNIVRHFRFKTKASRWWFAKHSNSNMFWETFSWSRWALTASLANLYWASLVDVPTTKAPCWSAAISREPSYEVGWMTTVLKLFFTPPETWNSGQGNAIQKSISKIFSLLYIVLLQTGYLRGFSGYSAVLKNLPTIALSLENLSDFSFHNGIAMGLPVLQNLSQQLPQEIPAAPVEATRCFRRT